MAKSDDWIMWLVGGIIAFLGYSWITSQKAGGTITDTEITPDSANVARTSGCGCGAH